MESKQQSIEWIFEQLWADYSSLNPNVLRIRKILQDKGEAIVNDHIALRTFSRPGMRVEDLAKFFLDQGYVYGGDYDFKEKKLRARHLDAPHEGLPKVFISELLLDQCSPMLIERVDHFLEDVDPDVFTKPEFLWAGRQWDTLSYKIYDILRQESEYAAWMYVFGFRVNHFTINVNKLQFFTDLDILNAELKSKGVSLNQAGGEIKGGETVYLSQSSSIADKVPINFTEGIHSVPSCFYEFALRHRMPNGELFQGFVADNADKIFESTNSGPT